MFSSTETREQAAVLSDRLNADHGDERSRIALARLLLKEQMADRALGLLECNTASSPELLSDCMLLRALALRAIPLPDTAGASECLRRALILAPLSAEAHLQMAHLKARVNEHAGAVANYEATLELTDDPAVRLSAYLGLSAQCWALGDTLCAAEAYAHARELYPGIDAILEQQAINRLTAAPQYAGPDYRDGSGSHPSHEARCNAIITVIDELERGRP